MTFLPGSFPEPREQEKEATAASNAADIGKEVGQGHGERSGIENDPHWPPPCSRKKRRD
jgi:hypothetical protein